MLSSIFPSPSQGEGAGGEVKKLNWYFWVRLVFYIFLAIYPSGAFLIYSSNFFPAEESCVCADLLNYRHSVYSSPGERFWQSFTQNNCGQNGRRKCVSGAGTGKWRLRVGVGLYKPNIFPIISVCPRGPSVMTTVCGPSSRIFFKRSLTSSSSMPRIFSASSTLQKIFLNVYRVSPVYPCLILFQTCRLKSKLDVAVGIQIVG